MIIFPSIALYLMAPLPLSDHHTTSPPQIKAKREGGWNLRDGKT